MYLRIGNVLYAGKENKPTNDNGMWGVGKLLLFTTILKTYFKIYMVVIISCSVYEIRKGSEILNFPKIQKKTL